MSSVPSGGDRSGGPTGNERLAKVERLRAEGIEPYQRSFPDRTKIATILAEHDPEQLGAGEHSKWTYRIAGRLTGQRGHGKTVFFDLQDLSGSMQAYARRDALGDEAFDRIEDLDIGDVVGVEGDLYVTKRGQLALEARECTLLAKSLRDPPDLYHGIGDPETRYRHRELDLMANERSREIFLMRAKLIAAIRNYMNEHDFVELETPALQGLAGGAAARPFKTHHNALGQDFFLRISSELHLKRAVVGGFENVYELGKFFRNEGISPQHNPEFTMMEWFKAGAEYKDVMAFTEGLVEAVVEQVLGTTKVQRDGETIDFAVPWERLSLRNAIRDEAGVDILAASESELAAVLDDKVDPKTDWAGLVDAIQSKLIEPKLVQPTFLYDLPLAIWPLVPAHPEHPQLAEAFDGIVTGMEVLGGGTDLNDPIEQRERFVEQRKRQEAGSDEVPHANDEEFVQALEYGMLTMSGSGLGIDRLLMVLAEVENLRDVILFPSMRRAPSAE
jgi:lysyl-tRNA synthetase, class II